MKKRQVLVGSSDNESSDDSEQVIGCWDPNIASLDLGEYGALNNSKHVLNLGSESSFNTLP